MIVFKKDSEGGHHKYSHIECDVPDCKGVSPPADELVKESLFARGWYIKDGKHRCPAHYDDDTPAHGPLEREADGSEGFVR